MEKITELRTQLAEADTDSLRSFLHSEICYEWCGINFDSAKFHADRCAHLAERTKNPSLVGLSIIAMGWVYDYNYQFDSAIFYYQRAHAHSQKHQDLKREATALFNIGVVFYYKGQLDSALDYYLKSQPKFELLNDDQNLSRLYNNLGRIYEKTNQLSYALEVSRNSIEIKQRLSDVRGLLNTYTNMSSIFQKLGNYDSALIYSSRCITSAREVGDLVAYKAELVNVGIIYKNLEQNEKAISALEEAESLLEEEDDPYVFSQVYHNLGEFYFGVGDLSKTAEYLQKVKAYLLEDDYLETALKHHHLKYLYQKSTGNSIEAMASLEKYLELNERYLSKQIVDKTAELEQLYEKEKREIQIAKLNAENALQVLSIEKKERERNGLVILTFLVIGALVLVYSLFRQKQRAANEKDLLLKEIHHRVKNNLQVISSLLNLQSESLESDIARAAVKEGQHRVKSMALIHQKLYTADDVRGVDVQDYMENLSAELFRAFGLDPEKVGFEVSTSGLKLDIDTVIPLGLIVNELITNSIKYAFRDIEKGLLKIEMSEQGENLSVVVQDNGNGMDEKAMESSNTFGWKMIKSLCRKLKAEISVRNDEGTQVRLMLSNYKLIT